MKSIVETNFKNTNLKLVHAFCRTPGVHPGVLPKSENPTENSSSNWCHSAPIRPPLTPLISLSRSRRVRERSFGRAVYRCQGAELLWPCRHVRSFGGDHPAAQLAQRRTLPLHLSPLPLLEATMPSRSPRSRVLARASVRRAPWPTMDGADARLELHCFPRPPDHLSRTYDLPATARTCRSHPSLTPASPAPRPRRAGAWQ